MPRTNQKTNHGSSKSLIQSLIYKNGSKTTGKEKALSSSSSSEDISSPYKNSLTKIKPVNSDDNDDFKTPVKMFTKMFKQAPSKKGKSNAKKSNNKIKNPIIKRTKDNFKNLDVDAEQLQMAIALSKSTFAQEYPEQALHNTEPDLPTFLSPNNIPKCTTFLEKYGFKSKRSTLQADFSGEVIKFQETKRPKKSKYRFVTPVLFLRSDKERKDLIDTKVSRLLSEQKENTSRNANIHSVELNSTFLGDYAQEKKCWQMNCFNDFDAYICPSLELSPTKAAAGYLLKDWDSIPGRARSPIPDTVSKEVSDDDATEFQHSSMKSNEECSSINQEDQMCLDAQSNKVSENEYDIDVIVDAEVEQSFKVCNIEQEVQKNIHGCDKLDISVYKVDKCISPDLFDSDNDNEYCKSPIKRFSKDNNLTKELLSENLLDSSTDLKDMPTDKRSHIGVKESPIKSRYFETSPDNFKMSSLGKDTVQKIRCNLYNKGISCDPPNYSLDIKPLDSTVDTVSLENRSRLNSSEIVTDKSEESQYKVYKNDQCKETNFYSCDNSSFKEISRYDLPDNKTLENKEDLIGDISNGSNDFVSESSKQSQNKNEASDGEPIQSSIQNISSTKEVLDFGSSYTRLKNSAENHEDVHDLSCTESETESTLSEQLPIYSNNTSLPCSSKETCKSTKISTIALSTSESPNRSYRKVSNVDDLTKNVSVSSEHLNLSSKSFVTKRKKQFTKFYSSEMLDMDLSDSEIPNSCVNLSGKCKTVSDDMLGINLCEEKNSPELVKDSIIDLSQTDSNDSESSPFDAQKDDLSLCKNDLGETIKVTIGDHHQNTANGDDAFGKPVKGNEEMVDLTHSSDDNTRDIEDLNKKVGTESNPQCKNEEKLGDSSRQSFGIKTYSRDSGNASCEFSSTKSLNVTDYVLGILNLEDDAATENNLKDSEDLPDAEYFSQSHSTCSQGSIEILDDEELNYSSKFSAEHHKDFYNLTNFDDMCINHCNESKDIDEVHLELKNKYCQQNNTDNDDNDNGKDISQESLSKHEYFEPMATTNLDKPSPKNNKRNLSNDRNTETPDKNSQLNYKSTTNTNTTPNENVIIKTNNITPMANYDGMNSPQIRLELDKFGIKPLKRRRGIQLLKYIYDTTHPFVQDENVEEVSEEEQTREAKRRKLSDKFERTEAINIVGNSLIESEQESDLLFERKFRKTIMSCRVPLQLAWYNFLCCNPSLTESIVLYEPIQLEVIHSMLKEQSGCNFHVEDLITFLDKKCITFRTNQWQGSRKKAKEKS
ncbi:unnamed protein product [Diabrotica balteata]|uniref:Structure-specific endonuclease subunit SLX4 n=1 Tax=Diabrotica balteata TaxID=107213 RepID=A0A9N9T0W3_DIABA|nr:unnamed protein product [Diabrotica balteata]